MCLNTFYIYVPYPLHILKENVNLTRLSLTNLETVNHMDIGNMAVKQYTPLSQTKHRKCVFQISRSPLYFSNMAYSSLEKEDKQNMGSDS